jgi:phosphosulfolactate synthase (CoM biosynthesis protein A)
VSDNYLEFGPGVKYALIRSITDEGLRVLAEVGHKEGDSDIAVLVRDINDSLDAGASVALLEAGEILGERQELVIGVLKNEVPMDRVLIEVPGHYLPGAEASTPFRTMTTLIKTLGIRVNLANLTPDDIMTVQSHRIEIASNIRLGDYRGHAE